MPEKKEVYRTAASMAWPAILESFFVSFAGLIDSLMVSSLGADAVAAVGLTTQPKFIGLSLFMALNVALSALVARRWGEEKREEANRLLLTALLVVLLAAVGISVLLVSLADPIIHLCGSTAETHQGAVIYFRIIMGGMIFNCVQMCVNAAQRGVGNTKLTMRTNLTSNLVNICFNYLLINGHFGFPALGIQGAALATVLGTVVASVMSVISLLPKKGFLGLPYIRAQRLRPQWRSFRELVHVGYGVCLEQLLMRAGFMLTALMAADQGTAAMAAHQVGMNLLGLSFSFGDGLQATAVALIGRSLGQGKPELARAYGKACQFMGAMISLCLAIIYFFGARGLMGLFFREAEIVDIGVGIMRIMILIVMFQVSQVVYMGCLRGAGDVGYTALASTISVTLIRTAVSYLCGYTLGGGILGIWMGVLGDQCSRFLFASIRFRMGKWVKIKI